MNLNTIVLIINQREIQSIYFRASILPNAAEQLWVGLQSTHIKRCRILVVLNDRGMNILRVIIYNDLSATF